MKVCINGKKRKHFSYSWALLTTNFHEKTNSKIQGIFIYLLLIKLFGPFLIAIVDP